MLRAPRPRVVELGLGFALAFGAIFVPGMVERLVVGDSRPRGHGGIDLAPLFFAALALSSYGLLFLVLPFTRWMRLASPFEAASWGVSYACGGWSAILMWSIIARAQRGGSSDFDSEKLFVVLLLAATIQSILAPGVHRLALSMRPALRCASRPKSRLSLRWRLPLLAAAASLLALGVLALVSLWGSGGRGVNPYLVALPPFAIVLVATALLLRPQLTTTRMAALYGGSYGCAVGAVHAAWLAAETGRWNGKETLLAVAALLACVIGFGVAAMLCRRIRPGR